MFQNCDIAGCEIQTGDMGTPPNRASLLHSPSKCRILKKKKRYLKLNAVSIYTLSDLRV